MRGIVNRILENSGLPPLDEVNADELAAQRADAAAKAGMKPGPVADPGAAADDVNLDDEEADMGTVTIGSDFFDVFGTSAGLTTYANGSAASTRPTPRRTSPTRSREARTSRRRG